MHEILRSLGVLHILTPCVLINHSSGSGVHHPIYLMWCNYPQSSPMPRETINKSLHRGNGCGEFTARFTSLPDASMAMHTAKYDAHSSRVVHGLASRAHSLALNGLNGYPSPSQSTIGTFFPVPPRRNARVYSAYIIAWDKSEGCQLTNAVVLGVASLRPSSLHHSLKCF